jgi:hypothetical protein
MENSIKIQVNKNNEIELFQESTKFNCYELVCKSGDYLSIHELQALNQAGFIYHSSQTDIDFENEDENGKITTEYMDIHYFAKVDTSIFGDCLPF